MCHVRYCVVCHVAVCCSVLQCVAVCCSVLQCVVCLDGILLSSLAPCVTSDTAHCVMLHTTCACVVSRKRFRRATRGNVSYLWSQNNPVTHRKSHVTEWRRPSGYLIFIGHFLQKSPVISGSFAERDLQLKASSSFSPPCEDVTKSCRTYEWGVWHTAFCPSDQINHLCSLTDK